MRRDIIGQIARKIRSFFRLAAEAFANLKANDPIRMAAATAFFTFFALPPIIIILSQLYGGLLDGHDRRVSGQLFGELADLFGYRSARQLQDISQNMQQRPSNRWQTGLSIFLLLLASTTLFAIIKNSLNQLWNVKPAPDRRAWHTLLDRAVGLGIILFTGFLFIGSLSINRALSPLKDDLLRDGWLRSAGHYALSVGLLTVWFAVVFKYLPDIRIRWRAVWVGALVTGLLVEAGEQILNQLLIKSSVGSIYGTSGAIILILLFVFYAALIFYYGASFTRQYAQRIHQGAEPGDHAVAYKIKEVSGKKT